MHHVTGIVVRDGPPHLLQRPAQRLGGQELGDVAHAGREARGAPAPGRIAREQHAVGLHVSAATRRVHDDVLHAGRLEDLDRAPGQGERGGVLARVGVERAAAGLRPRRDHLGPVPGEHAGRRAILGTEGHLLDAAGEQPHPDAAHARGRRHLGQRRAVGAGWQVRQERLPVAQRLGQEPEQPGAAHDTSQAAGLVDAEAGGGQTQERRIGQQQREVDPPEPPAEEPARPLPLDLGARGLDELAVRDAGRAGRLAGAAAQAEIEMGNRGVGQVDPALGERLDQHDAAARRVHLRPELGEGRAVGEAEPAVHAAVHALDAQPVEGERLRRLRLGDGRVRHRLRCLRRSGPGS